MCIPVILIGYLIHREVGPPWNTLVGVITGVLCWNVYRIVKRDLK